ncbi:hypothetical protein CH296_20080 [Rhodococcus sp. 14-2496-1d]|nr:hypothetical protein CH296_20080 [Rhodococcus sp. 14-2496-1d]
MHINSDAIGSMHVTRILNGPDGLHEYRVEYRDENNHFYVELCHQESRGALELTRRAIEAVQAEQARQAQWVIDQMKAVSRSRDIIADLSM